MSAMLYSPATKSRSASRLLTTYPWIVPYERQGQQLQDFPRLKRWFESIKARAAVVRAYDQAKKINTQPTVTEESKRILFGQTAAAVGR